MSKIKHFFAVSLIAMLMSVTGLSSVSASAANTWNTSEPKMDISVQSNAQNRTFAIRVYNKSGANYYKVLERGQDSKTGKWTSWTTVKGYYSFSGKYKRFTIAKNANDTKIYHYRLVCYNSNDEEIAIDKRLETAVPSSVKVTSGNDSKTGKAQNTITWSGKIPTGFQLWRATSKNGTYRAMGGCIQANTYTDTNVTEGVTYYYKLRSYKKLASARYYSNYSSIVSVKTNENKVATPTVSSFTYNETNGFTVKYKSNTTSFDGFEVKILDKNNNQVCYKQTDTKTTSVTLNSNSIKANTKYTVQVKAFNTVNGTKKYSAYASKDLTTPKQAVIKEGDRPSVKDVTYHENCTYTDGSGDDGKGNLYYIFVGYSREFELSDENGKALSTSNTKVTVTENGTDKTSELVKITNTSKGISIEPKKATSGKVTIKFARTNSNVSVSYQYKFVQIANIPSSIYRLTKDYDDATWSEREEATELINERDSSRYALSQIKNNYNAWLNGKEDSLFNKLLYSYEVTTRTAGYSNTSTYSSTLYGGFITHGTDCGGATVVFENIAMMLGVPSEYLDIGENYSTTGIHSYNMVTVDGNKWYKVDCDSDRYFDHQNGTPSYSSFMKGYYGFACSSQAEYDNAVAKVKSEFANAIKELNTEKGYSFKVGDELPSGARCISEFDIKVETGAIQSNHFKTLKEYLVYDANFNLTNGYVYVTDCIYTDNGITSYTNQGIINFRVYAATNKDATSVNKINLIIDADGEVYVENSETEDGEAENNTSEAEPTVTAEPTATPSVTPSVAPSVEPTVTPEPTFEPTEDSEVTEDTEETVSSETDEASEVEIEIEAETSSETELTDESLTEESN